MSAVAWISLSVAASALIGALVYGVKRFVAIVRSEAMLAAALEREQSAHRETAQTTIREATKNAALQNAIQTTLGAVSMADAASVRTWWQKIDDAHGNSRAGAVLDQPAGASVGSVAGASDDHDTEPNARGIGDPDAGSVADASEGGERHDEVGSGLRGSLRGKR